MKHSRPTAEIVADPASFRDPDARVIHYKGRVYRRFTPSGATHFRTFADTGLLDRLVSLGQVIGWQEVSPQDVPELYDGVADGTLVIEHPAVPFLSYCYEWSFEMLRHCALLHLELLRECLEHGYILKDATPYNVQFIGPNPLFIDIASFVPWREGTPWQAYAQFCRLLLNPLLLTGLTGVKFNFWLRSSLEGIAPEDLSRVLPLRTKFRRGVFVDVVLQAWFTRKFGRATATTDRLVKGASFGLKQALGLANRLERTLKNLKPPRVPSNWVDYETHNSYATEAQEFKDRVVEQALNAAAPSMVWDLGCNTGRYSLIAARHAKYVVAMDSDTDVVEALHDRVRDHHPNILPLVIDLMNPSPDQGWNQSERGGMTRRARPDFVLCLALVPHLAIGGNLPLTEIGPWLGGLTKGGVIEFVPRTDSMVQGMLRWREDAYPWYEQADFEEMLRSQFRNVERSDIPGTERALYVFSA